MCNEKLMERICKLVAMSYAMEESIVYECYKKCGSIDEVIRTVSQGEKSWNK